MLLLFLSPQFVLAESIENISKAAQNPLARNPEATYYSLPLNSNFNFGYSARGTTQYELDIKPVIPFPLTTHYDLILRPILSLYHQSATPPGQGYINGWSDLNPTVFISPSQTSQFIWGVGPDLFIPMASNQALGSGKWSIGPQAALVYMPDKWLFGLLTSNVWSVAGDPARASVNQFSFQYFISYHFPQGWYLTTQPTITANWKASGSQQWTVPLGLGIGRTFSITRQLVNVSLQSYYNIAHPTGFCSTCSRWVIQFNVNLLFPTRK